MFARLSPDPLAVERLPVLDEPAQLVLTSHRLSKESIAGHAGDGLVEVGIGREQLDLPHRPVSAAVDPLLPRPGLQQDPLVALEPDRPQTSRLQDAAQFIAFPVPFDRVDHGQERPTVAGSPLDPPLCRDRRQHALDLMAGQTVPAHEIGFPDPFAQVARKPVCSNPKIQPLVIGDTFLQRDRAGVLEASEEEALVGAPLQIALGGEMGQRRPDGAARRPEQHLKGGFRDVFADRQGSHPEVEQDAVRELQVQSVGRCFGHGDDVGCCTPTIVRPPADWKRSRNRSRRREAHRSRRPDSRQAHPEKQS